MQDYCFFAKHFVSVVVGKKKFEGYSNRFAFSGYVTVSDEAFALLLLENNYNRWIDMGKTGNWLYSDVHPLYTSGGNVKQTPKPNNVNKSISKKNFPNLGTNLSTPSTAKYQGWSNKGIKRFNYLFWSN